MRYFSSTKALDERERELVMLLCQTLTNLHQGEILALITPDENGLLPIIRLNERFDTLATQDVRHKMPLLSVGMTYEAFRIAHPRPEEAPASIADDEADDRFDSVRARLSKSAAQ